MTVSTQKLTESIQAQYTYILNTHWNGEALVGPDPGVRFNARIWRFAKSILSFWPWSDKYTYAQAQKYWIVNNWLMIELGLHDKRVAEWIATTGSGYLLSVQREGGYWDYPNPEWKDRIATVEGNYAAWALLDTYRHTQEEALLAGAIKWYECAVNRVGFQGRDGYLGINYFANVEGGMVPNNSASTLPVFAKIAAATGDEKYLELCGPMVAWLNKVQLDTGELPYATKDLVATKDDRIHFLCYQYNAFQFLNIAEYYRLTQDANALPILEGLAYFVSKGMTASGASCYDCNHVTPEVSYYTAASAAALRRATVMGIGDFTELADQAYNLVLSQMNPNGSMSFHSRRNYRFLSDKRSYPRYLSMVLHHLLLELKIQREQTTKEEIRA